MAVCKSCNEPSVESVDYNGEEQQVCTLCGLVQERGSFAACSEEKDVNFVTNNNTLFVNQTLPLNVRSHARPTWREGVKQGCKQIAVLTSHFNMSSTLKTNAINLYLRATSSHNFYNWPNKKKVVLAGCCVYAVMRQLNWPITVSHICGALGCCREDFSQPYFKLIQTLSISIPTLPIEELVDEYINKCENLDKSPLKLRVLEILQIAKGCWLTVGRMPRPILLSAIYLAWQSLSLKLASQISFKQFCVKMKFTFQTHSSTRKNELYEALCALANKIPWFEPNYVTKSNLYKHLEEILKYSQSLLHDLGSENTGLRRGTKRKPAENAHEIPDDRNSEDFSDEELNSYIRSTKEVKLIQAMLANEETDHQE